MLDLLIKPFVPEKMILVAVCAGDEMHIFDRQQFGGILINKASRPWGTKPDSRGRKLVKQVAEVGNQRCTVVRSAALAESVHFVFWFPKPDTFKPEKSKFKTVCITDQAIVSKPKRRVIETALVRAREKMTRENLKKIA